MSSIVLFIPERYHATSHLPTFKSQGMLGRVIKAGKMRKYDVSASVTISLCAEEAR